MYTYQTKSTAIVIKTAKPIPKVTQKLLGLRNVRNVKKQK